MLKGKTVVLGVTGSIAAYKICYLASALKKLHADVHVIMTKNATNFVNPITFETLTGNKCLVDTFDRNFEFNVEHVSLAKKADIFLVAPATANVIGKIASGICDDMLTTTLFAFNKIKLISPAMNTNMYNNPILQDNLLKLKKYGYQIIEPAKGILACGDEGVGKLPSEETLLDAIVYNLSNHDLQGKKILITAGATKEAIDPVRYITNHSSGKMGFSIANKAYLRGADVKVVTSTTNLKLYDGIELANISSAKDMYLEIEKCYKNYDYIIMAAAVADYTPKDYVTNKIKKSDNDMSIELKRTDDILSFLGKNKQNNQKIIGFSMETENLLDNSKKKLEKKNADMICANSINGEKTGFKSDTNQITLITKDEILELPFDTKDNLANMILDKIIKL